MTRKIVSVSSLLLLTAGAVCAQDFTAGNLVVLQTSGSVSKASSAITLKEFTTSGTAGVSVDLPNSGLRAIQTSGVYGGSEGFLTTSTDKKYLVLAGYGTASSFTDITSTNASTVTRVIGTVAPSGFYLPVATSNSFFSGNDIRGAVADGSDYWASGASVASADGINYFGTGTAAALATGTTPPKAYGLRIFNGQIYYSTQKSGPTNTSSQLGIFALGTGKPTSGTVTVSQVINTGSIVPQDFSFSSTGDTCYIAISLNTAAGGIQKWVRSSGTWSLAYTIGTGATNTGAYGIVADYSGSNPVLYATTFESTGNRIIKVVDNGSASGSTITTLVSAVSGVFYKGITFAPVASGTPVVQLTVSSDTASEAGMSVITIKANASASVTASQTISLNISGTGITSGDYSLSASTLTIPAGSATASATFTVKDDILGEGTETARIALRSASSGISIGWDSVKTITIADNDGNNIPVININTDSTTDYIDSAASGVIKSSFVLSGVKNNPTDPANTLGVACNITDLETPSAMLGLSVSSSDTNVVPLANITITGTDSIRYVHILPKKAGYSDIRLTVSDGIDSSLLTLHYAASEDSIRTAQSRWHTGISDASAAIALDDDYFIVGDDELNVLNVYSRKNSGMRVKSFEYTSWLSLPNPSKPEVDLEAGTRSLRKSGRCYWMGSMSNGKSPFDAKPNRNRLFATDISGTGAATTFTVKGYTALRDSMIVWGDANGYNFTASAAAGVDSKLPNGFAAEGMVFGPDSTTLYIAMRAPLVPVTSRKNALIAPIRNFDTWFNDGSPSGPVNFGAPIELNLGGRGIRDIMRTKDGVYIIVAGNVGGSPLTGAIYKWSGKQTDTAVLVTVHPGDSLNFEGVVENGVGGLQLITDNGDDMLYNDGTAMKDFGDLILRKFRSVVLTGLDLSWKPSSISEKSVTEMDVQLVPNPAQEAVTVAFTTDPGTPYRVALMDLQGRTVTTSEGSASDKNMHIVFNLSQVAKGFYFVQVSRKGMQQTVKLLVQ